MPDHRGPRRPDPAGRRAFAAVAALALLLAAGPGLAGRGDHAAARDPRVQQVLDRIDRAQQGLVSLRAKVVEVRRLALLAEPQRLTGELLFERPGRLRWEYRTPERRTYVLADGKLIGWAPDRNEVERVSTKRYEKRLRRLIAIGEDAASIVKEFKVALAAESEVPGADELILVPRSHRVRKRVAEIRLWISRGDGLPHRIRYRSGDGDVVTLELVDIEINPKLPSTAFTLAIPPDAKVVEGLASLGFPGAS